MFIDVVAPDGGVTVTDSEQSFDSRKLTGAGLSLEIGSSGTDVRTLLDDVGANARVRYAHQYGRGTELSPFFYVDDKRTYFVEPLPDAPLPIRTVPRPTAGFALRATTTAPAPGGERGQHHALSADHQQPDHRSRHDQRHHRQRSARRSWRHPGGRAAAGRRVRAFNGHDHRFPVSVHALLPSLHLHVLEAAVETRRRRTAQPGSGAGTRIRRTCTGS